jgi:hypothetical protein
MLKLSGRRALGAAGAAAGRLRARSGQRHYVLESGRVTSSGAGGDGAHDAVREALSV